MSRIGPVPSDKLTVPAHKRRRRHEEGRPGLTSQQPRERREYSAIGGGVPRTRHLVTKDAELMAEYRDLDVLLVRGRSESNQIEQLTNEQEGDRTAHSNDRGRCTAVLVSGRIARLHPSS
jgi:hypothetical protein